MSIQSEICRSPPGRHFLHLIKGDPQIHQAQWEWVRAKHWALKFSPGQSMALWKCVKMCEILTQYAELNWPGASIFRVSWWWRQTFGKHSGWNHRPETVKKSSCVDPCWSMLILDWHLGTFLRTFTIILSFTPGSYWWSCWSSLVCCARPSCE